MKELFEGALIGLFILAAIILLGYLVGIDVPHLINTAIGWIGSKL
jgi:hypothetical protein